QRVSNSSHAWKSFDNVQRVLWYKPKKGNKGGDKHHEFSACGIIAPFPEAHSFGFLIKQPCTRSHRATFADVACCAFRVSAEVLHKRRMNAYFGQSHGAGRSR